MRRTSLRSTILGYARDCSGAAAVEFALWLSVITLPLLNAVDLGIFAYQRMQVEQAAQMAVQEVYNSCSQDYTAPYLTNCGTSGSVLTAAATSGAQSTTLGTDVSVTAKTEGDYCVVSGALTTTGCSGSTGHYVLVTVQYTYKPLFRGASIVSVLNTTMTRVHYIRMT